MLIISTSCFNSNIAARTPINGFIDEILVLENSLQVCNESSNNHPTTRSSSLGNVFKKYYKRGKEYNDYP